MRVLVPLLLVGALAVPLRAEEDREARARALQATGAALFQTGDLLRARTAFAAAQALVPERANPYRWLGLVDAQLGRCGDALPNLEVFLAKAAPDDPRRPEVVAARDRCKRSQEEAAAAAAARAAADAAAGSVAAGGGNPSAAPGMSGTAAPSVAPTTATTGATPARQPVYRKWWLWTVVGAVAVGAGFGIGFGVASTAGPAEPFDPVSVR